MSIDTSSVSAEAVAGMDRPTTTSSIVSKGLLIFL